MKNPNSELIPGRGALITFEGGDGSGKGTQTKETFEWLLSEGLPVLKGGYPMYDTPTGKKVSAYLNGEMGRDVSAEDGGKLYQEDRKANKGPIHEWVRRGGIYLLDRYVESNSHQGGKLKTLEERIAYLHGNAATEYGENGLMVPDLTLLFTLAPELAQMYVEKKTADSRANYTTLKKDIHEDNVEHLANANEVFLLLPDLYPGRFHPIDVTSEDGTQMRPIEKIQEGVRSAIRPLLIARGYDLAA